MSICGHIAFVFVCARYRLMDGYQLVLLTVANLIRTCFGLAVLEPGQLGYSQQRQQFDLQAIWSHFMFFL